MAFYYPIFSWNIELKFWCTQPLQSSPRKMLADADQTKLSVPDGVSVGTVRGKGGNPITQDEQGQERRRRRRRKRRRRW